MSNMIFTALSIKEEKAMAPHSSTLAWKIPWMEEPGRLQSMGSLRVGHDWTTSLSLFTFLRWRRKWQPTPVFLPGESQGRRSLVGCRLWGRRVGHGWCDLATAAIKGVKQAYCYLIDNRAGSEKLWDLCESHGKRQRWNFSARWAPSKLP